jgi:hypothetical protein
VALLVFVLIALVVVDGRVTSLMTRLQGINQNLGYLRPVLNLFGLGIVLAFGWVVWRRILELPFPELLKDKRILGVAKYALVVSALVIAGIEAGTRWLPAVAKEEAATFSLPISLLILALLVQTLQKVLSGEHGGEGKGKSKHSEQTKVVFWVLGVIASVLLVVWLALKIQGVIWAQGASHRMDLATEAERRVRQVLAAQSAGTWHGLQSPTIHSVELSTNWSRVLEKPLGMKSRWNLWHLPELRVRADGRELNAGIVTTGDPSKFEFRLAGTNGLQRTNLLVAFGY